VYTINVLNLPGSLRRCLASTNLIDSTDSGVRQRTRRVTNWQDASMALRWAAAALVETEKHYRRIMGYEHLWVLKAALDEPADEKETAKKRDNLESSRSYQSVAMPIRGVNNRVRSTYTTDG
jgi:hypothetical protein